MQHRCARAPMQARGATRTCAEARLPPPQGRPSPLRERTAAQAPRRAPVSGTALASANESAPRRPLTSGDAAHAPQRALGSGTAHAENRANSSGPKTSPARVASLILEQGENTGRHGRS
eukprot:scaffold20383_cov60-Phaeocystis_antarctica.AAC.1